jgi:hypothetical protein
MVMILAMIVTGMTGVARRIAIQFISCLRRLSAPRRRECIQAKRPAIRSPLEAIRSSLQSQQTSSMTLVAQSINS